MKAVEMHHKRAIAEKEAMQKRQLPCVISAYSNKGFHFLYS